ncbi:LysR family transcriptional regulator [Salipiger sp. PrR002]|uniref:LysR family transcriptional regulator n=1 Tax=Salipiger sp. PrR002 TaxID=2706489 RepID=UPI0013B5B0DD|nr:LysR family transcriptional regulator [Salipiger sp. PrR002]NDW01985.1 LysR family transcriptional regulator [Salipiger sp. PrR002]NDW59025.1 LysR family transcriptional regulator [Salipiger sp. PrR004]
MKGVEVRHLRYFMRVAQELHFGRAAEILGVSQAPLSQQIRQLEERIGVRLFDRTTRTVTLTPAGRALFEKSGEALLSFQDAIDEARTVGGLKAGRLRIGAMSSAIYSVLPKALRALSAQAPAVQFDMSFHTTEEQLPLLAERKIDVAFIRPPRSMSGLQTLEVHREGFAAVLPSTSPLAARKSLRVQDLKDENFIGFSDIRGISYQEIVFQHCRAAGFSPNIVQRVSHTKAVVVLVAAGLGIGVVPRWVEQEPMDGLVVRPLDELPEVISLVAAWRADGFNPFVELFVQCLKDVAREKTMK